MIFINSNIVQVDTKMTDFSKIEKQDVENITNLHIIIIRDKI